MQVHNKITDLQTFLKHYESMEYDYMATIEQIELANTMEEFNRVMKQKAMYLTQ